MQDMQLNLQKALDHFTEESKKIRTGRALPSTLDGVKVEVYGQMMPLAHVANVTAPDAVSLAVSPFDPANIQTITSAIKDDESLNLNPTDDGRIIRIPMPAMTEETRREAVKKVGALVETTRISMRQSRHEYLDKQKSDKKDGLITEDDLRRAESDANDLIAEFQDKLDAQAKAKEDEILSIG